MPAKSVSRLYGSRPASASDVEASGKGDVVHQQRVAVGRRLRHHVGADRAARAAAILHQHRLPHRLLHALRDDARGDVGGAARRERHDDADRFRRKSLRLGEAALAAASTRPSITDKVFNMVPPGTSLLRLDARLAEHARVFHRCRPVASQQAARPCCRSARRPAAAGVRARRGDSRCGLLRRRVSRRSLSACRRARTARSRIPIRSPGTPASAMVGSSGSRHRALRAAHRQRTQPAAFTCGRLSSAVAKDIDTWPAIRSATAGPPPL